MQRLFALGVSCSVLLLGGTLRAQSAPIRAGIIGADISHAPEFAKLLNEAKASGDLSGVRVAAACPVEGPDGAESRMRLDKYVERLEALSVEIVPSIDALLTKVDAVMLISVDGVQHLEQARAIIKAGKPLFIDKPMAASLADVVEIFRLAEEAGVPCFSSSSLRFNPDLKAAKSDAKLGELRGCDVYAPCPTRLRHPDLYWYGVHGVETLFAIMGSGCTQVVLTRTEGTELATGVWSDGRLGTFRGLRDGKTGYGAVVFSSKGVVTTSGSGSYEPLAAEICKFFRTGKPPVRPAETIELFAFMEAAEESHRQGGVPVTIESVMAKAKRRTTN